jgi:hypothetical protein
MSRLIKKSPKKNIDEKKEILIKELVEVFNRIGYEVRIEKGMFKGGYCLLREEKLFLLNRSLEQDKKICFLARNLGEIGIDRIYIKPNIRELIETESGNQRQSEFKFSENKEGNNSD